jgi:hypothetical protein
MSENVRAGDFRVTHERDALYRVSLHPADLVGVVVGKEFMNALAEVAAWAYNLGKEAGGNEHRTG